MVGSKFKTLVLLRFPHAVCAQLGDKTYGIILDTKAYSERQINNIAVNSGRGYKTENQAWAYVYRKKVRNGAPE